MYGHDKAEGPYALVDVMQNPKILLSNSTASASAWP
jgi:hypothetical protein